MSTAAAEAAVATRAPAPGPQVVRRQRVKVPWRLVESSSYEDVALSVYVKVKALQRTMSGCEARTETIAGYLGLSAASVARGSRQLTRPAPSDGVVEMKSRRRTMPGGRGTSAARWTRPMSRPEKYVWLPVAAAEELTPRQLRAYSVVAYAQARGIALTLTELAEFLRHHSGKKAGHALSTTAAAEVVDSLEASRWITVDRRGGHQGRHLFTALDCPPAARPQGTAEEAEQAVENPSGPAESDEEASASPRDSEGSGPQVDEGSLANKDSLRTDSLEDEGAFSSPAVGEVQVSECGKPAPSAADASSEPAGLALRADENNSPADENPQAERTAGGSYDGPQLSIDARIYAVLEPVHWLLKRVDRVWLQRQIAREVGRQLRSGIDDERLRSRLERRFATVTPSDIRDPGRWLLGVALPRWGCALTGCEEGVLWSSGRRCEECAAIMAARRREQRLARGLCPDHGTRLDPAGGCADCAPALDEAPRPVPAPRVPDGTPHSDCRSCGCRTRLIGRALEDGLCKLCREETAAAPVRPAQPAEEVLCQAPDCTRGALPTRAVCVRHRAQELVLEAA